MSDCRPPLMLGGVPLALCIDASPFRTDVGAVGRWSGLVQISQQVSNPP
jgi:hypothetical protein